MLVLILERVNDKPLTLNYLRELIKSLQGEGHKTQYRGGQYDKYVHPTIGDQGTGSSYWVLMTRDILPGSRNQRYSDQCKLVADHATRTDLNYELPGALEAVVVMLLHHARSSEYLYGDDPLTYTRCRDRDKDGDPVIARSFSSWGLVISCSCRYGNDYDGVAGLRKF
ncbi:MAG: hypothetical protein AAF400_01765 [Bacteroidota bacterium]